MSKEATKRKLSVVGAKRGVRGTQERVASVGEVRSKFANELISEVSKAFNSEDEALELLISNITEKLAPGSQDQGQMHDFLKLVLETDPSLKAEILKEISEGK